ncbi:hypothetical protein AMTRI_Chr10g530 [Amborella trichopoda]|uniref:DUF1279 domain-containing protein n=1 Tax=Amborella trichopoda TaxID=13333 RepID=W1NWB8_AMBTC|nr:uncharacterized protein LOC18427960 [Amborella trichopoda]XP_020519189.1 uncharacterized protein LOC18427960 [Amborella trichopoda]XP_020519190.1 uncharacterized protein LOC18427960 [Amborella trichopoda]XP_020519191.1 uncharacterized protein LOC18427960 [Amborella trichopoda]ERM99917.1 hypothetical protein AMTR_s00110p00081860 [Amborella trichopoda]|eukprot:XP_006837064.1 uncharacterized protein LOC18427960 [Amborella trichopoda]
MAFTGRMKELMKKYGKVALGVHLSVSAASVSGLYVAIKNNVDVESMLGKIGLSSGSNEQSKSSNEPIHSSNEFIDGFNEHINGSKETINGSNEPSNGSRNRTAELAASSGGALALAILCNKALFPVRVPITLALTPPISRFIARRKLFKTQV